MNLGKTWSRNTTINFVYNLIVVRKYSHINCGHNRTVAWEGRSINQKFQTSVNNHLRSHQILNTCFVPFTGTPFSLSSQTTMSENSNAKYIKMDETLVWVDLEMTGLNIEKDKIMEAAVLITDSDLNIIKEGPNLIIKTDDDVLDNMDEWCKKHHGESGLTQACRDSEISLAVAEEKIFQFVVQYTETGKAPLAGNSIHADKKFLDKYMPKLMKHLHYRIVDVSTIKELCRRWYPKEFEEAPKKQLTHRALDDIRESISELKYYKSSIFK